MGGHCWGPWQGKLSRLGLHHCFPPQVNASGGGEILSPTFPHSSAAGSGAEQAALLPMSAREQGTGGQSKFDITQRDFFFGLPRTALHQGRGVTHTINSKWTLILKCLFEFHCHRFDNLKEKLIF